MSWEWQGTENLDRLTLDFVLFFLSHVQARVGEKVTISPACYFKELFMGRVLKPILERKLRGVEWSGFPGAGRVAAPCPSEFTQAQRIVCPKTGTDLSHHRWADVITNTARKWGCFPEMAVQFRESTTWLPDGEPTLTMISRFKNPLQFKYFMLNRFLCEVNAFSTLDHMHVASQGRWEFHSKECLSKSAWCEISSWWSRRCK